MEEGTEIAWAYVTKAGPKKVHVGDRTFPFAEIKDRLTEVQRDSKEIFYLLSPAAPTEPPKMLEGTTITWANVTKGEPKKVYAGDEVFLSSEIKDHLREVQRDSKYIFYALTSGLPKGPPKKVALSSKPNTIAPALVGAAGVHHVVSDLSMRGMIALPTIRNTAAYDVIVASCDGKQHANIQVKTSQYKVDFWPMPQGNKIRTGESDYYVLLRWLGSERRFEGFMVTGNEAQSAVEREEKRRADKGQTFPTLSWENKSQENEWRRKWEEFEI